MRSLNQLMRRNGPVAPLSHPCTPRFFSTYRGTGQRSFQDHNEQDDYAAEGEDFDGANKGYGQRRDQGQTAQPVYRAQPFNPEGFKNFHSMTSRDLSAYIAKEAEGYGSAEQWLSSFANGLKNAEANNAWKDLSPEGRKTFVNNMFHLNSEAQILKKRFNLFPLLQFLFEKSLRFGDAVLAEHILNAVKETNVSRVASRQVVNSYFMECVKFMTSKNLFSFRSATGIAEAILHEAVQGAKVEPNTITAKKNYGGLANYLAGAAYGQFNPNRTICKTILHTFANYDLRDTTSNHAVLGWAAASVLANSGITTTIEGSDLIGNLNDYIRFVNEEMKAVEPSYDEQDATSADGRRTGTESRAVSEIMPGRWVSQAQFSSVSQGLFLSETEKLRPMKVILELMLQGMRSNVASLKFRKWLCGFIRSSNLDIMNQQFLIVLGRLLTKFVYFRRFPQVYKKLYTALQAKADLINNNRDWAQVYIMTSNIVRFLNGREENDQGAFDVALTDEEKNMYLSLHNRALENVLKEDVILPMDLCGRMIYQLRVIMNRFTSDEIKATKLHSVFWEQFEKRKTLTKDANIVFKTLLAYDLFKDEEAQQRLLVTLDKSTNKMPTSNEDGPKEALNRTHTSLNRIMDAFDEHSDKHTGIAKEVHEKLKEYKSKERVRAVSSEE